MYIKIINGIPHPYSIYQLRQDNPQVSFPIDIPQDTLAEYGVFPLIVQAAPPHDPELEQLVLSDYYQQDGMWQQHYVVQRRDVAVVTENILLKRNQLLQQSDWTQLVDASVSKASWAQYRQALRDLDLQPGFPWEVQWPTPPSTATSPPDTKLVGIEFDGVMCSATSQDQSGLTAVLLAYQLQGDKFQPTKFEFENGNSLVLTRENFQRFASVWMPFRQSFFKP